MNKKYEVNESRRDFLRQFSYLTAGFTLGSDYSTRDSGRIYTLDEPRIVVVKSDHELTLMDGDDVVGRYIVSTGSNPSDKVKQGDKATPEGKYYICQKAEISRRGFGTRWMRVSYPNGKDAERGLHDGLISESEYEQIVNTKRGETPPRTKLGSGIGIHGGFKPNGIIGELHGFLKILDLYTTIDNKFGGLNYSHGCVMLEDDNIESIYPHIPIGTEVIIKP